MAPHDPRNPPKNIVRFITRIGLLPKNFLPHPFQNAPPTTSGRDEGLAPWPRTKKMISDQLCEYYGLITQLDHQVVEFYRPYKKWTCGQYHRCLHRGSWARHR